jgi:hypothetical protein
MIILTLKINGQTASKRTRNRIKEAGPDFIFEDNPNRPNSILVKSITTGWFGWLPKNEIVIKSRKEIE